ncbi:MAG: hypothetical protein LBC09_04715 [Helicobacteraceae bacterium]|jgi:hypothetical protein|nr:hypothetical protein [Helicobacteraceae bacterium]
MQISDISNHGGLERQTSATSQEAARKSEKINGGGENAVEPKRQTSAIAAEFESQTAKLSAVEFYAQAKTAFSQSEPSSGAEQTAQKLTSLIFEAAEDDENLLKSAKQGLFGGFGKAEQSWGGALPQSARAALDHAVYTIDMRLHSLGFPLLREIA